MNTIVSRIFLPSILCFAANLWAAGPISPPRVESPNVAQARELLDAYYGARANLSRAAELLADAYQGDQNDANVYVQAARITVMGGRTTIGNAAGGAVARYGALLDKAIALDDSNPKAHILKAEFFQLQGRHDEQLSELDKAKALGTKDPWLLVGYGAYYRKLKAYSEAYEMYAQVEGSGPGSTASDRKAYISALQVLRGMQLGDEDMTVKLRKYAALALKARYPTDALTPQGYAESFIDRQLFDEAIFYAREALNTMDSGAGRLTLAASLYSKAAQLLMAERPMKDAIPFIDEARKFGFSKAAIIEFLVQKRGYGDSLNVLTPTLNEIIR